MSDPVTDALARIAAAGDGYALITDGEVRGYYVQFVANGPALYGEMPGNGVLGPDEALSDEQQGALRARGWAGDGVVNWSRTWPGFATDGARAAIAAEALGALRDVYGWTGDLHVNGLETGSPELRRRRRRRRRRLTFLAIALFLLATYTLWLRYFLTR